LDDRELVQKLLQGDLGAQREFDRTYRPKIYRACCHLLGYRDKDAEDVVQDVLLTAHQKLSTFEFRSSLHRWLHQIAMYKCYRVIRNRRRQVVAGTEDLEALAGPESMDRQRAMDEEKRRAELAAAVRVERDALGEPCRTMLAKRAEAGLTYGQLADELRIPVGTVMSRLARCLEALRNRLSKRWKARAQ